MTNPIPNIFIQRLKPTDELFPYGWRYKLETTRFDSQCGGWKHEIIAEGLTITRGGAIRKARRHRDRIIEQNTRQEEYDWQAID